ncbi:glutathione peroxidase [Planococcus sp. FY231025]|uniref:glutathione peroxidase n=1 Tax=Planococcus sp. FY231025 TaxID=3455699 RepID=UPI003F93144B
MASIYDFEVKKANGEKETLEKYRGHPLVIVNTASKCGFTPQFEGLEKLYEKYKDQGLEILGFPCGQFNDQEFESQEEIMEFCQVNYGVTFPVYAKVDVKGDQADPLFRYLTSQQKGMLTEAIKWNFTKFLVDRDGNVVKRFAPQTPPSNMEEDVKNLL